jgi:hypothetical protein
VITSTDACILAEADILTAITVAPATDNLLLLLEAACTISSIN